MKGMLKVIQKFTNYLLEAIDFGLSDDEDDKF